MEDGEGMTGEHRWAARPVIGRSIHAVGVLSPVILAIATGLATGTIFGRPDSLAMALVRVVTTAVVSMVVMASTERVFRRLLPIAAMYRLTLVFPDHAPSRFAVALRSGNSRYLERRIEDIRAGVAPSTADQSYYETLLELTAALNRHDRLTRGHCERTRAYTEVIIKELELPSGDADRLRWASLLHDVGKLGVDAEILNKPGKPTETEWEQLRAHPEIGARLAAPIASFLGPWMSAIAQHHERWDGGGYPSGLAGREIHLGGRIVAVADAYDVMTSARSYKRAMSPYAARQELVRCAGTQFDPEIVRAFLATSLGRSRWSLASLGSLIHLREAFALVTAGPVAANVATAAGAVAMTTAAVTGAGVVDNLMPPPVAVPAGAVEFPDAPAQASAGDGWNTVVENVGATGTSEPGGDPSSGDGDGDAPSDRGSGRDRDRDRPDPARTATTATSTSSTTPTSTTMPAEPSSTTSTTPTTPTTPSTPSTTPAPKGGPAETPGGGGPTGSSGQPVQEPQTATTPAGPSGESPAKTQTAGPTGPADPAGAPPG